MTISVVQATTVPNAFSGNFAGNVAAGDGVFLVVSSFSTSNVTISSSAPTFGGSPVTGAQELWTIQSAFSGGGTVYSACWMLPDVAGGSSAVGVTITNGSVNANSGLLIYEVSAGTVLVLDKSSTGTAANNTAVSSGASGNITQAPEFVLGGYSVFNGTTGEPGAPWTSQPIGGSGSASAAGYQIPTSPGGSYTWSATGSSAGPWAAGVATVFALAGTVQPLAKVPVPRRRAVRAYVRFTPVMTTNAAAGPGIAGTIPVLMTNQTRVVVRRDGRVVRR